MPVPAIPGVPPFASFDELVSSVTKIRGELVNLLLNLDTLNVVSLDAKVITAGTITADKIGAGEITTDKLDAGAVTADKINVTELSAITADLGHITAGLIEAVEIYGSYIATAQAGVYPRIEFSSDSNVLVAEADADNKITVNAHFIDSPALEFDSPTAAGTIFSAGVRFVVDATIGDLQLSGPNIRLLFPGSGKFILDAWSRIYNGSQTLQDELDTINLSISGKATAGNSTGSAGPFNGGIPIGTQLAVNGGGFVTWAGIGAHSHTQT